MNKEAWIKGVKFVLSALAGVGITALCGAVAGNVTQNNNMKTIEKACVGLAGLVIGGMISEQADGYIDRTVDQTVETATNLGSVAKVIFSGSDDEKEE